jgi:negative regulator of flagellin synthesis FlgM
MTDPISNVGRSAAQLNNVNEKAKAPKADDLATEKPVQSNNDELVLSEATEKAMANAEFDAAKVARIKEAIEQGNYPIDAKKVAESFASLERMIGGS